MLWSYTGEMNPLDWLVGHWDYQKGFGRLASTCEGHAWATFPPKQVGESRLKTALVTARVPMTASVHAPAGNEKTLQPHYIMTQCSSGSRTAMTREKAQLWDAEVTQSWGGIWLGRQQPLLAYTQAVHQKQPRTLMVASHHSSLSVRYQKAMWALQPHPIVWLQNRAGAAKAGGQGCDCL